MDVMTVQQVADKLKVSKRTVVGYIQSGSLKASNVAPEGARRKQYRITEQRLEMFLRKRECKPINKTSRLLNRRKVVNGVTEFF